MLYREVKLYTYNIGMCLSEHFRKHFFFHCSLSVVCAFFRVYCVCMRALTQ